MTEVIKNHILKIKVGTAVVVTVSVITTIFGFGICYEKMQARLRHLDAKTSLYQTQFDGLEARVSQNEALIGSNYKELTAVLKAMSENISDIKNSLRIK